MIIEEFQKLSYRKSDGKTLQAKVWFAAVSSIEKKKSYGLDLLFSDEKNIDGTLRKRMFENAENGMLPSRGQHPKRNFDLISIVDAHPKYKGTKLIFESPFWLLLYGNYNLFSQNNFRVFLSECIVRAQNNYNANSLKNTTERYFEFNSQKTYSNKLQRKIKIAIPYYLLGDASFDILAVIGGLYREAYLSCADNYAIAIKEFFLDRLFDLLKSKWLTDDLKKEIFRVSNEQILCPISQYSRNKSPSISLNMKSNNFSEDQIDFIKLHNKFARQKFN